MKTAFRLLFDIQSDWHIGNGTEAGAYADALILRDSHGLPYLPGKSVKGLLRQAFANAAEHLWFGDDSTDKLHTLFGEPGAHDGSKSQGLLQLSSAELSISEKRAFCQDAHLKRSLTRTLHMTAIDATSGTAKDTSLRSMEVAVPMVLTAELMLNRHHPAWEPELAELLPQQLEQCLCLICSVGAKRNRGLGRVCVTLQEGAA